jgi:hypothetical protein
MGFIYKQHYPIDSYLINKCINIIDHLEFDPSRLEGWEEDFIIAGDFIHNILNYYKSHEIDFYVLTEKGFRTLLCFFYKMSNYVTFSITKHSIDININDYSYMIKLHNRLGWSIYQCMESYYFDYKKCFFDGQSIKISQECNEMMLEKKIYRLFKDVNIHYKDILDAINKGYKFKKEFLKGYDIIDIELEDGFVDGIKDENNNFVKKKYIGMDMHDELTFDEITNLLKLVEKYQLYENDKYNYIFTIHNSLETILILLSLIHKYTPIYTNICGCDCCEINSYETYNIYNENTIDTLTFYTIINFLNNDSQESHE